MVPTSALARETSTLGGEAAHTPLLPTQQTRSSPLYWPQDAHDHTHTRLGAVCRQPRHAAPHTHDRPEARSSRRKICGSAPTAGTWGEIALSYGTPPQRATQRIPASENSLRTHKNWRPESPPTRPLRTRLSTALAQRSCAQESSGLAKEPCTHGRAEGRR